MKNIPLMSARHRPWWLICLTLAPLAVSVAQAQASLGDPLVRYQWHLSNDGSRVFADGIPTAGVDMNIGTLHQAGVRGAGVRVAVIDDGLDIRHEDLRDNVALGLSRNFVDGTGDPTPADAGDSHGTGASGIIGAVGWNGLGGRGIAPSVLLTGFNMLASSPVTWYNQDANIRYAWGSGREAAFNDVFNNSWGIDVDYYPAASRAELRSQEKLMASTRFGRGGIYVKSAGNSFLPSSGRKVCADALRLEISCVNSNTDPMSNLVTLINVAAINAAGRRSSYSSAGSSVWISAPGGEYGYERRVAGNLAPVVYEPAIVTTDLAGCNRGASLGGAVNTLPASGLDPTCSYRATYNGTSAAAPMVSGVAALMLGVNPALTARDVKYILAATAWQIDPAQPVVRRGASVLDPGWVVNAAGHPYSNWYGYGMVDASTAVRMARAFKSLPRQRDTGWVEASDSFVPIGGEQSSQGTVSVDITNKIKVEAVQLAFATTHPEPSNLRAVLTSPSGTQSYVLVPYSDLRRSGPDGFKVDITSSSAFLDEKAQGKWTLRIVDVSATPKPGQITSFSMRVVGN